MASSEIQLTQILWDIIEGNMSLSEAWDKANYDSFRISELDIGNNLRTSTWCLAQLIPIKAFTVILKSNVEMWCCYFLFFSCLFLMCLCPLWILKKKFIVLEGFFFVRTAKFFQNIYDNKEKIILSLYVFTQTSQWHHRLLTLFSHTCCVVTRCFQYFSLLIYLVSFISHVCIYPSIWTYINAKFLYIVVKNIGFTSQRGSAHVLWVNCVIIYVNYVHRSYTLPLGEMQIRTFCSLFVFKYIHFSLQGSGQTPCLFSHRSSFVCLCK